MTGLNCNVIILVINHVSLNAIFGSPLPSPLLQSGIPSNRLPLSRMFPSFIAAVEISTLAIYVTAIAPRWSGTWSPLGLVLVASLASMGPLHLLTSRTDPGYLVKEGKRGFDSQIPIINNSADLWRQL